MRDDPADLVADALLDDPVVRVVAPEVRARGRRQAAYPVAQVAPRGAQPLARHAPGVHEPVADALAAEGAAVGVEEVHERATEADPPQHAERARLCIAFRHCCPTHQVGSAIVTFLTILFKGRTAAGPRAEVLMLPRLGARAGAPTTRAGRRGAGHTFLVSAVRFRPWPLCKTTTGVHAIGRGSMWRDDYGARCSTSNGEYSHSPAGSERGCPRAVLEHQPNLPVALLDTIDRDPLRGGSGLHSARLHVELRAVPRALYRAADHRTARQ